MCTADGKVIFNKRICGKVRRNGLAMAIMMKSVCIDDGNIFDEGMCVKVLRSGLVIVLTMLSVCADNGIAIFKMGC